MATIIIPTLLRKYTNDKDKIFIEEKNITSILNKLIEFFPQTKNYIYDASNKLNTFIMLYQNNKIINTDKELTQSINNDDVIEIILSFAGG